MLDTFYNELEFVEQLKPSESLLQYEDVKDKPLNTVWSITEDDHGVDMYANAGFHVVNVIGYVTTEVPWVSGNEWAEYFIVPELTCPECEQVFSRDGDGHAFDAIAEHGMCHECLGYCPYCNEGEKGGHDA